MNKATSLRALLVRSVPGLADNPERLLTFIDQGNTRCIGTAALSFEYHYTLNVILTDFAGHPDSVVVPVLSWLKSQQPDAPDDVLKFEADLISTSCIDLSLKLQLSERVLVTPDGVDRYVATHVDEPPITNLTDVIFPTQVIAGGVIVSDRSVDD